MDQDKINCNASFIASCYLCSSCRLHCKGGYMCRCRSPLCSDILHVRHSQIPEHTHPHLNTQADQCIQAQIFVKFQPPKQDFYLPYITDLKKNQNITKAPQCYVINYLDRLVDFLPTSHCWHSALWCLPAGKSHHYTDRPQSCQHGSLSPETSRSPEDEEAHRTLL